MPSRYVCSVLEEMREAVKLLNTANIKRFKDYFPMLLEETQTSVNRMEAGLGDNWAYNDKVEELHKLKKVVRGLRKKKKALEVRIDEQNAALNIEEEPVKEDKVRWLRSWRGRWPL